jgi:hypothetical protein
MENVFQKYLLLAKECEELHLQHILPVHVIGEIIAHRHLEEEMISHIKGALDQ